MGLLSASARVGLKGDQPWSNQDELYGLVGSNATYRRVKPKIGLPQNGWFIMKNETKRDDLGAPLFHQLLGWSRVPLWQPHFNHFFGFFWEFRSRPTACQGQRRASYALGDLHRDCAGCLRAWQLLQGCWKRKTLSTVCGFLIRFGGFLSHGGSQTNGFEICTS